MAEKRKSDRLPSVEILSAIRISKPEMTPSQNPHVLMAKGLGYVPVLFLFFSFLILAQKLAKIWHET